MKNKVLSPHITVYKWQITMVLSILHRLTGVFLFFSIGMGTLALSIISDYSCFNCLSCISCCNINLWLMRLILSGFLISALYHLSNGVRFLYLDITGNINKKTILISGLAALVFSAITALALAYVFFR